MKTRYKLYKDGKKWVVGAIAVAGIASTTALTNHVSADTTSDTTTSQTNSDGSATALNPDSFVPIANTSDNTSTTSEAFNTSEANTAQSDTTASTAVTSSVANAASTIPTSVASNVTQSEAKQSIDQAQGTVQNSADSASHAGVHVTQEDNHHVTLTDDNAAQTSSDILNDLHQQDEAIKQAEATQKANEAAKSQADEQQAAAEKQGQADLQAAHDALNTAIAKAQESGVKVSTVLADVSPKYQSLKGLTGQDLLKAMANNIKLYRQSIAKSVASEATDTANLAALTAEYNQAVKDYETATANRNEAQQTGSSALEDATSNLKDAISDAKKAGVTVNEVVSQSSPAYKDLKGLTGKALLDAMAYNIGLYNKAINDAVTAEKSDTANLKAMTAEYQAAVAKYNADKAAVDKANADKKAAYDKMVIDRQNAINAAIAKGDQHTTGTYDLKNLFGGYLNGIVHYDYTYHWDANKNTFIVTAVSYTFESVSPVYKGAGFWDTVYIQGPKSEIPRDSERGNIQGGADLKETGNSLWDLVKDTKYGVMFYLSQNNKTGEVVTHYNISSTVPYEAVQLQDGTYELARFVVRNLHRNGSGPNSEYANWIDASKIILQSNIPVEPSLPPYEDEPIAPTPVSTNVTSYTVDALPEAEAPVVPEASVTKYKVTELPSAETPKAQEVAYHLYNVSTTPAPVATQPKQEAAAPVVEAALPETSAANYDATQVAMASLAATLMAVGLVGAKIRYHATLKNNH